VTRPVVIAVLVAQFTVTCLLTRSVRYGYRVSEADGLAAVGATNAAEAIATAASPANNLFHLGTVMFLPGREISKRRARILAVGTHSSERTSVSVDTTFGAAAG
jgi:hypothetical protein